MADRIVTYRNPAGVRRPNGLYSHLAILNDFPDRLCFVGGQVGVDLDGEVDPAFDRQMEQVFANLGVALADAGTSFASVLQLTTYLIDAGDIDAYFAKRVELFPTLFPDEGYPANALIVVSALARPALRIEVLAVAAITDG